MTWRDMKIIGQCENVIRYTCWHTLRLSTHTGKSSIHGSNASSFSASYGDLEKVLFPEPSKYQTPILIVVYLDKISLQTELNIVVYCRLKPFI